MQGHLIHIGFPKAGSTFLQEWFLQNPHLLYAPGGLAGFHNVYGISHQAVQSNAENFSYFVTSDESLTTPRVTTGTIPMNNDRNFKSYKVGQPAQRNAAEILKSLYPNAKILFITRGFKGMIMSGFSQTVRTGGTMGFHELTTLSLEAMAERENENNEGGGMDFTFIADLYEELFGRENMIILPYELLRDDQDKFLSLIEEQLGLPHFDFKTGRINESLTPEELYWYPRISSVVSKTSRRLGARVHARIYRWYVNRTFHNRFRPLIQLLNRIKPGRTVKPEHLPTGMLNFYRHNNRVRCAARFRYDPLYEPYLSEYLLDA